MGYRKVGSIFEPQRKFEKLIRAYEKAEQSGYYNVAGAEPALRYRFEAALRRHPCGEKAAVGMRRPRLPLRRGDIWRRTEVLRQTPRDPSGGSVERCGRSAHGRAGLEQSGTQRK